MLRVGDDKERKGGEGGEGVDQEKVGVKLYNKNKESLVTFVFFGRGRTNLTQKLRAPYM